MYYVIIFMNLCIVITLPWYGFHYEIFGFMLEYYDSCNGNSVKGGL